VKEYKIKKDKHYPSGFNFGITFSRFVKFRCKFDKSCLYYIPDNDKYDINKLCGFSTTWFHHKQSGRVGWRCVDGESIEILTYSYNNGVREQNDTDFLGIVMPEEEFEISIYDNEDSYIYTFEIVGDRYSKMKCIDNKKKDWFFFHYLLYPYFGGNKTAPHDMSIYLKRLK
jgi:hypothetical protein